jgi:L-2-hydroxyglutarate oxidase LhgO
VPLSADVDLAVVGGGVVGLAIAAQSSGRGREVAVLERHRAVGQETSSRNSEVVHAGLYYPPGTLKARLCVEGARELYALARRHGVAHRRCGKLVVAVASEELDSLRKLRDTGLANGATGLRLLDAADVRQLEPNVSARAALLSPDTGIVDSHALTGAFLGLARDHGATVAVGTKVLGLSLGRDAWRVTYRDGQEDGSLAARAVVNAAGLEAQSVMRMAGLDPDRLGLSRYLCKGEYFAVRGPRRAAVRGLVYPSPEADLAGLGIHTVVDLGGGLRLGPNAFYVQEIDYDVDPAHRGEFLDGARTFLRWLQAEDLVPAMAGVRPKLAGPGEPARDFHIAHEAAAGAPGFFNLAGIESPGLTASPAIARLVADMVDEYLSSA